MNKRERRIHTYSVILKEALAHGGAEGVREACRELCVNDLFYLLSYALNRVDVRNNDWLYERCREVEDNPDGFLDLWAREHYKDLADDTPMLTTNGWTTHGELQLGDIVFAPSGEQVKVIAVSSRFVDSQCYRVTFSDGAEIVAGAGHRWRIKEKHRLRCVGGRRVTFTYKEVSTKDLSSLSRADVGSASPLNMEGTSLPIPPYTLGLWLGDGNSDSPRITVDYNDIGLIDRVKQDGFSVVEHSSPNKNSGLFSFGGGVCGKRGTGITPVMREIGILGNKHIPGIYLFSSSVGQRMDLLRGLMDSDGHCNTRGTATFCNQNERLVDDVLTLAAGLGLRPRKRKYGGESLPYWQVSFQAHSDRNPFWLERKAIRAISPSKHRNTRLVRSVVQIDSVPTKCIQVEGGVYLAGRELVPTKNSTIITFAKTIQDILKNPEITVGILSHTKPIARAFLGQIKYELETNEFLHHLFPDILYLDPKKEAPLDGNSWSEDKGITVKRKSNPKEATVEAHGLVDGQPTSKHYSLLVYDDVVTDKSVTTPEMIEKTTDCLSLSFNLGARGGKKRFIGTRYHFNDTYKTIIDRGIAKTRIHAATDDGTVDGNPVFLTREQLEEKRREQGAYVFGCQQLQNPISEGVQNFKRDWLRYYSIADFRAMNRYLLVDPASSKKKTSDYTVMWVIGLGVDMNYYLIDGIRERLGLNERTSELFRLHRKHKPIGVGYEQYGMQADIEHMEEKMESVNYRFKITPLSGSVAKVDRIKRLQPKFEQGRFFLPRSIIKIGREGMEENLIDTLINDEYLTFPVCGHDDMLDDLANILHPDMNAEFPAEVKRMPVINVYEPLDSVVGY